MPPIECLTATRVGRTLEPGADVADDLLVNLVGVGHADDAARDQFPRAVVGLAVEKGVELRDGDWRIVQEQRFGHALSPESQAHRETGQDRRRGG